MFDWLILLVIEKSIDDYFTRDCYLSFVLVNSIADTCLCIFRGFEFINNYLYKCLRLVSRNKILN
jgi:hypothetical protein